MSATCAGQLSIIAPCQMLSQQPRQRQCRFFYAAVGYNALSDSLRANHIPEIAACKRPRGLLEKSLFSSAAQRLLDSGPVASASICRDLERK